MEVNILIFFVGLSSFVFLHQHIILTHNTSWHEEGFQITINNLFHQDDEISIGQLGRDGYDCYSICVNDHLISSNLIIVITIIVISIILYISEQQYLVP